MEKKKLESEVINYQAWLSGLYVYDAISTALYNSFAKQGSIPRQYLQQPIELGLTKEEVEMKKRKQLEENIKKSLSRKKALIEQGEMR